jgi:hypothetical protein
MPRESRSDASRAADVDESVYVDNDEEAGTSKGAIYFYSTDVSTPVKIGEHVILMRGLILPHSLLGCIEVSPRKRLSSSRWITVGCPLSFLAYGLPVSM